MEPQRTAGTTAGYGDVGRCAATPIGEYGLIGDTRTAALLGRGSIDWLCLPRFDADPVFARLVGGEGAGAFSVRPAGDAAGPPRVRYRRDSAVLETVWQVDGGEVRLVDGMVADVSRALLPQALLVRRIEVSGRPTRLQVRFDPRRGDGRLPARAQLTGTVLVCRWAGAGLALSASAGVRPVAGEYFTVTVAPGRPATFALAAADREPLVYVDPDHAFALLERTERWWRQWADQADVPPFGRDAVVRSLITLRLLTYAPSGAPVASPTTSLPEWPGGARNWDYRYAWPRDASLGIGASLAVGNDEEAGAFLYWLLHAGRLHRPHLPPLLRLDGRSAPVERILDDWPGYDGARPVRVGNGASHQHQLDGYGWVVDAAWAYGRVGRRLYGEAWRMVAHLVDFVADHWRRPDAGIWEPRDEPRHYIHSKLMAWVALDRAIRLSSTHRTRRGRVRRWAAERDALARSVREHGFDDRRGSYVRSYGGDDLDAALLLLPILEFDPPSSPRVAGTVDAIRRELSAGGPLIYRYTPGSDGLEGGEGAFLPCSFWLVQALARIGRTDQALAVYEDLLGRASPLGLFAEEMHPVSGEQLGNMPMVFTHAALVQAALALRERATPRPG